MYEWHYSCEWPVYQCMQPSMLVAATDLLPTLLLPPTFPLTELLEVFISYIVNLFGKSVSDTSGCYQRIKPSLKVSTLE